MGWEHGLAGRPVQRLLEKFRWKWMPLVRVAEGTFACLLPCVAAHLRYRGLLFFKFGNLLIFLETFCLAYTCIASV